MRRSKRKTTYRHCAEKYGLPEADHRTSRRRGVTLSYVCSRCHRHPLEDYIWWGFPGHGRKQCNWWCAACGGQYDWRNPAQSLGYTGQHGPPEAKVFRVHAAPHGVCDNLIIEVKHSANQRRGDSPVECWLWASKNEAELRRLIMDNHEAAKIGDLEQNMESRPVVKPKITADFPEAVVREVADELPSRREAEGMFTANVGGNSWRPPFVDEDWRAICQAIFKGVE